MCAVRVAVISSFLWVLPGLYYILQSRSYSRFDSLHTSVYLSSNSKQHIYRDLFLDIYYVLLLDNRAILDAR